MSGHGSAFSQCPYRHKLWCLVGGSSTYISPQYALFAVLLDNSTAENGLLITDCYPVCEAVPWEDQERGRCTQIYAFVYRDPYMCFVMVHACSPTTS